jgi:hypothetical protein
MVIDYLTTNAFTGFCLLICLTGSNELFFIPMGCILLRAYSKMM